MELPMRIAGLALAVLMLDAGPAAAMDVCTALLEDEGVPAVLSGVLSVYESELYITAGGCSMLVSLPNDLRNVCPLGSEVTVGGELDLDYDFVTDDLIIYADEIECF
jgi:hypothetical protein